MYGRRKELIEIGRLSTLAAIGILSALFVSRLNGVSSILVNCATAAMTFASIAFAACLTGAVLALTVPTDEQRKHWSGTKKKGSSFSHFSDLMFVFTWSAMCQIPVMGIGILVFIGAGSISNTGVVNISIPVRVSVGLLVVVGLYALLQLTAVVRTISQLAVVGAANHSKNDGRTESESS